jgi:threonine/homoserine/homoserine lactone efflux protein
MAKAMSIAGMVVSGLLFVVFAADLALGIPFGGQQKMTDAGFVVGAGLLAYLSWNAFRDSK